MKWKTLAITTILAFATSGCVRLILPTSLQELEQRALQGQREVVVDIDHVSAYRNIKRYYDKCVNDIIGQHQTLYVNSQLDREKGEAQFIGKMPYGTYSFLLKLHQQGENQTKITYTKALPKVTGALFSQQNVLASELRFLEKLSKLNPEDWRVCNDIKR